MVEIDAGSRLSSEFINVLLLTESSRFCPYLPFTMTSNSSMKQRRTEQPKKLSPVETTARENGELDVILKETKQAITSEWDYKLALVVITALAFLTRFWGIGHPNEVVFDEVHFGKVRIS